ncbi:hypothetical protein NAEGRDRAFT_77892 [Naegleria gruberi]|uniref:Peroxisomal ATPase PEX1 N-terminal C-lobe domain-containing protein n=1 Tax=Naegleria gruberi TaxID=5762 RepID=D2UZ60_NAEGR|nr:Peroxin 1 (Pex1), putative [Naegleria gruberi]EFC49886.1 hypothetical protein NAEGRDRAFT_77892 [Naegleria gruberi]|eukprot:XP_002682630.1 hypothetical protein NAEGRDRAFT_77892 [Naegleria gruberi strain NEG-M]
MPSSNSQANDAFSEKEFQVFLTSTRDCYVQLPHEYVLSNAVLNESKGKIQVFKIINHDDDDYLCWSWHTHQQAPNKIGIPSTLAKCLEINENDNITIKLLKDVKMCKSVFVRPETIDDSEILEFNQNSIEEELLSQVRIAYRDMKFPLFINNNISITLNTYQCGNDDKDTNVYIIDSGTELIVETKHEIIDEVKQEKKKYYIKSKLEKLSTIANRLDLKYTHEQIDDDKFIYVSKDIATKIGLVSGDLVQVLHLNIIRKNIIKDETEQAEEQKNPLDALKEFEEKKERVCFN